MKKLFFILAVAMMFNLTVCAQGTGDRTPEDESDTPKTSSMKIKITSQGRIATFALYDTVAAKTI
jgi:hypothetical protein